MSVLVMLEMLFWGSEESIVCVYDSVITAADLLKLKSEPCNAGRKTKLRTFLWYFLLFMTSCVISDSS